ncbi:MAG TPA: 3'(2'),5'-bisphosphate nucleotidase CysQ [Steroidobacteraceae bacterium]|nr:3'(2'),5'-bisphosphate nucleotidase CysQ [Steroidobacteraceae bacterium]
MSHLPIIHPTPALRDSIAAIARRAGETILEVYRTADFGATSKADDSPLTLADLRSHEAIVESLGALTPGVPILSEESSTASFEERSTWPCYWLVDPLDGTKEFLARNGEFTVNIALIAGHEPVLGVVGVPARDTIYTGLMGVGATRCLGAADPVPIRVQVPAASPVRVVGSRSHRGDSLDQFLARLGPHEFVPTGSALKFCVVAEGAADVYPRLGLTSEWDTAAAQAVLTAAGGAVVTTTGEPLRYNAKAEILNPFFIAYGDVGRDWVGLLA